MKKYCEDYHNSLLGSHNIKNDISKFSESSLTRFAIEINSNQIKETYIIEGTNLNNTEDYVIDFKQPTEFSQFMFLSNFFPGTLIDLLKSELSERKIIIENIISNNDEKKNFFIDLCFNSQCRFLLQ